MVGETRGERAVDQPEPAGLGQHRLIGEVEHPLGAVAARRGHQRIAGVAGDALHRQAVVGHAVELLAAPEQEHSHHLGVERSPLKRRTDHRRMVLTVDQRQCPAHVHRPGAEENFS